jgi:hypothetical protein
MIDHILGRPSPTIRRSQIFLVLFFWIWRLYKGDGAAPLPSRAFGASAPLPSARVGSSARTKRTWAWRLWIALVGRSRWTFGLAGKLNHRLSE